MGTTADFVKLRSKGTPKMGEWNIDYKNALATAKSGYKFIVTCWSNGDKCSYCTALEKCFMQQVFKDWIKQQGAYFVFQYSGDADKGQVLHDWIYKNTKLSYYPGVRVTLYDPKTGKILCDYPIEGNKLRGNKAGINGAKQVIAHLEDFFRTAPSLSTKEAPSVTPAKVDYKIRFNEKLTVKKVNAILDAIDKNGGYCPCQIQCPESKCHCKDFLENKKIGEVCICNLFVKVKK